MRAQGRSVWRTKLKDPIPTCGDSNNPENSHLSHEPDLQGIIGGGPAAVREAVFLPSLLETVFTGLFTKLVLLMNNS